jgi:two-component system, NarL family, sensor kinase
MQPSNTAVIILLLVSTLLLALLVACAIVAIYLHNRWRLAQQQSIQALQSGHSQQLLATRLEVQEQTLQQLMREIHDNIGSSLTYAKLALATLHPSDAQAAQQQVQMGIGAIGKALEDIRNLSKSLNADFVAANGLLPALEHELQRVSDYSGLGTKLLLTGDAIYLDAETELVLFRMVQEALTNTIKHAQATQIRIIVTYNPHNLHMIIEDNGQGFVPVHQGGPQRGSGLGNLQQRARLLGGHCEINSAPGMGTRIIININTNPQQ